MEIAMGGGEEEEEELKYLTVDMAMLKILTENPEVCSVYQLCFGV